MIVRLVFSAFSLKCVSERSVLRKEKRREQRGEEVKRVDETRVRSMGTVPEPLFRLDRSLG